MGTYVTLSQGWVLTFKEESEDQLDHDLYDWCEEQGLKYDFVGDLYWDESDRVNLATCNAEETDTWRMEVSTDSPVPGALRWVYGAFHELFEGPPEFLIWVSRG